MHVHDSCIVETKWIIVAHIYKTPRNYRYSFIALDTIAPAINYV